MEGSSSLIRRPYNPSFVASCPGTRMRQSGPLVGRQAERAVTPSRRARGKCRLGSGDPPLRTAVGPVVQLLCASRLERRLQERVGVRPRVQIGIVKCDSLADVRAIAPQSAIPVEPDQKCTQLEWGRDSWAHPKGPFDHCGATPLAR